MTGYKCMSQLLGLRELFGKPCIIFHSVHNYGLICVSLLQKIASKRLKFIVVPGQNVKMFLAY